MNFDDYITTKPSKIYKLENGKLEIDTKDEETYLSLFSISPNKGIGNAEVAIYWLFLPNSQTNHGGSNSDLIILSQSCEIKSYPNHFEKVNLGRWKNDKESHYLINSLFSYYNINQKPYNFYSETNFNIKHVKNSYESLFETNKILSSYTDIPYINQLYSCSLQIISFITGSSTEEISKNLIIKLVETKLNKKPGNNGYIINVNSNNPLDIYIHKINISKLYSLSYEDIRNNIDINAAQIRINYKIFQ